MKQKNKDEFDCVKSYTQCIQWNLGDIPSLGLVNGDYLDDVVYAIVNKLCELSDPLDLSTLSLQCLIDKLNNTEPVPRTIQTIFQLLIDNECTLKDLIDNLQTQINDLGTTNLVLNLKCLAQYDVYGNPLPYDLKSVLQGLIDIVCQLKTDVTYLLGVVVDLQNQINAIQVVNYTLPNITTCISSNKRLDLSVIDIATSLCTLRNATGTEVQLQTAMSNQCSNFNSQFGLIPGWNVAPVSLAQSYSNLELAFCNVLGRLIAIEQTCCAPSCDKVKIGFTVDVDYDLKEITLSFTSGAGTFIPVGFVDCGSVISISDENGNIVTPTNTTITQNGVISGISFNSLTGVVFTISIKTKFCLQDENGTTLLVCQDCISKVINIEQGCPVCKVCVSGKTGYIDITYILDNQYQVIRILPGQCNYIPTLAKIIAIDRVGDSIENSDCLDLSNIETKKCYKFSWSVTVNANGDTDAWEDSNVDNIISGISVNGVVSSMNVSIADPSGVKDFIGTNINPAIISNLSSNYLAYAGDRYIASVSFKSFSSISNLIYLTTVVDNLTGLKVFAEEVECE